MAIDIKTVQKLADLARLDLNSEQEEKMRDQLGDILNWVEQLDQIDTSEVAPLASVNEEVSELRVDRASNFFEQGEAVVNAPESGDNYFIVPKVLG
ncbi:Asp-tRNA(Asn)/Glu-tRNA(Gln) amidotransferase subunit GatC [Reichenbachiella agariperforans]|uniref:Asp-tRNA(Asn)/Glu-tRNA(Gln) amidotransferase subunit GatC n=1 Tax=Reichenbachiella agariperforans TaxID=156994 RepID=UPI001C0A2F19|nr:Asp-tRNA(Asn)/Glu-tRNA(Gln) amidotransferase subunit GatC [Reichenbachiella agariperforans]MBU2915149.1 Asp-tRNA(Asn)/Glu-tRNA(Gln) amidotransferase subunit GatC [Reichenbachiella agariperforans]